VGGRSEDRGCGGEGGNLPRERDSRERKKDKEIPNLELPAASATTGELSYLQPPPLQVS
jgi:hypothetical protein